MSDFDERTWWRYKTYFFLLATDSKAFISFYKNYFSPIINLLFPNDDDVTIKFTGLQ